MEETKDNMTHIEGSFYIVRTQAGFRKAYNHYDCGTDSSIEDLRGYPTSYPSLVCFSRGYMGYTYTRADCIHLNKIKE